MAQLNWTESALADLNEIAQYIALDKPTAAEALVKNVFDHVGKLAAHPRLEPRIPELLPSSRYRQVVESPCRVFYRYDQTAEVCHILSVIRGERLFQNGCCCKEIRCDSPLRMCDLGQPKVPSSQLHLLREIPTES
jgi:toxin ParE1/3/4